jgi:hypothetical protein
MSQNLPLGSSHGPSGAHQPTLRSVIGLPCRFGRASPTAIHDDVLPRERYISSAIVRITNSVRPPIRAKGAYSLPAPSLRAIWANVKKRPAACDFGVCRQNATSPLRRSGRFGGGRGFSAASQTPRLFHCWRSLFPMPAAGAMATATEAARPAAERATAEATTPTSAESRRRISRCRLIRWPGLIAAHGVLSRGTPVTLVDLRPGSA